MVLERGEVANSWRRERWDSLRLLTPNWQSRLPGYRYEGADPDGFMTMSEVIAFVSRFAVVAGAPVRTHTTVTSVRQTDEGYHVATDHGDLRCRCVVLASGACNLPSVPALRQAVPASIECFTALDYRNPDQLPDGGVLIVGASATGVQLADEIHRSGRPVTLSVGEHVRLPRTYRGRDVLWWMDASGVWNQRYDEIDDLTRARRLPSPQLVGTPERTTLDLNALGAAGVEIVGRLAAVRDGRALFSGGLRNQFALADLKMDRLLDTFDDWARSRHARCRRRSSGALRADPRAGLVTTRSRPPERRDPFDHLGDRVSPGLQLARCSGGRSQGPPAARWRGRRCAGAVCHRTARPPATQVDLHPWRRGRRARSDRSPRRLPRHARDHDKKEPRRTPRSLRQVFSAVFASSAVSSSRDQTRVRLRGIRSVSGDLPSDQIRSFNSTDPI